MTRLPDRQPWVPGGCVLRGAELMEAARGLPLFRHHPHTAAAALAQICATCTRRYLTRLMENVRD